MLHGGDGDVDGVELVVAGLGGLEPAGAADDADDFEGCFQRVTVSPTGSLSIKSCWAVTTPRTTIMSLDFSSPAEK